MKPFSESDWIPTKGIYSLPGLLCFFSDLSHRLLGVSWFPSHVSQETKGGTLNLRIVVASVTVYLVENITANSHGCKLQSMTFMWFLSLLQIMFWKNKPVVELGKKNETQAILVLNFLAIDSLFPTPEFNLL